MLNVWISTDSVFSLASSLLPQHVSSAFHPRAEKWFDIGHLVQQHLLQRQRSLLRLAWTATASPASPSWEILYHESELLHWVSLWGSEKLQVKLNTLKSRSRKEHNEYQSVAKLWPTCHIFNMATGIRTYHPIQQHQLSLYASCSNWTAWRHSADVMAAVKAMGFGAIARCGISANSDMLDCHILVLRYTAAGCLWLVGLFDGNPEIHFLDTGHNSSQFTGISCQWTLRLWSQNNRTQNDLNLTKFYEIFSNPNKHVERIIRRVLPFSTELMAALKVTTSGSKPCNISTSHL